MKLTRLLIGTLTCVALGLSAQAQTETILDFDFEDISNPASPTPSLTSNPSGAAATATILEGNGEGYIYGSPESGSAGFNQTGLWALLRNTVTPAGISLTFDQTPVTTVDLTLALTHFVSAGPGFYAGNVELSLAGAIYDGRTVLEQQGPGMTGYWAVDTWTWNDVSFPAAAISFDIAPLLSGGFGGLLVDEVKLTINGDLTAVPEPMSAQLAMLGLAAFGLRNYLRRKA